MVELLGKNECCCRILTPDFLNALLTCIQAAEHDGAIYYQHAIDYQGNVIELARCCGVMCYGDASKLGGIWFA